MGQTCQKRRLAPTWVMKTLHREQLPVHGVVRLIQQRAHCRHLRVFEHCVPARFLVLYPVAHTLAVFLAFRSTDVVDKTAQSMPKRYHPQACALTAAVQPGVETRAPALPYRG